MIYKRLLVLVWLFLIAATAMLSWPKQHQSADNETPQIDPLRYQILALQVKLSVGAHEFALQSSNSTESGAIISSSLTAPLTEVLMPDPTQPSIYKIQYVLASYFKIDQARQPLDETLRRSQDSWDKLVLQAYQVDAPALTPNEREGLIESLGEFAPFLNATPESLRQDNPEFVEAALHLLYKVLIGFSVLGCLALVALISFCTFCYLLIRGKLSSKPTARLTTPEQLLEAFCLYIAGMVVTSLYILPLAASTFRLNPLFLNIIIIPCLLLTLLWPLARGSTFHDLRAALALQLGGIKRVLADIFVAPFAYLAGWVVIALVLIAYAAALQAMKIDPSSGSHPVVPMLLGSNDSQLVILVALLAVVVAPVIEEIMFRGALYGWLRAYLPAWSSILVSSACFAIMHPQGAIGIVPLGLIGILLAILREWRGSLVAPMVAHACFNGGTLVALLTLFR